MKIPANLPRFRRLACVSHPDATFGEEFLESLARTLSSHGLME